jgi:hypothetical protein
MDRITRAFARCLEAIMKWKRRTHGFSQSLLDYIAQAEPTLSPCVVDCPLVDRNVPKVVTPHLELQGVKGILDISRISCLDPVPVYQLRTAGDAPSTFRRRCFFLRLIEAMESDLAVGALASHPKRFQARFP